MKTKLELAHEFYLEKLRLDQYVTEAIAWEYAENMYKEMEENSPKHTIVSEYPEYDVTRTYQPEDLVRYSGIVITAEEAINLHNTDTFQVDWSVAPEWAKYWAIDGDDVAHWYEFKPYTNFGMSIWSISGSNWIKSPQFNYEGDWKESLQERP